MNSINWHNLKTRQCPKCDSPLQEGQYDYLCTSCDFKIKHYRYDEIVSQPIYKPYDFSDDLKILEEKDFKVTLKNPANNHYHVTNGIINVNIWAKSKRCMPFGEKSFEYESIYEVCDYINSNSYDTTQAKEEHETALNAILDRLHKR